MELTQQLTSLELSRRLKALGVKQESLFYWWQHVANDESFGVHNFKSLEMNNTSAFTVAELGELLPTTKQFQLWVGRVNEGDCYHLEVTYGSEGPYHMVSEKTEADARAKMLIYLLENGLITSK